MAKRILSLLFLLTFLIGATAQKTAEQMGGVYYAYHAPNVELFAPAPTGYRLCYLSHYGRHGSRWLPSDKRYEWVLSQFEDVDNLTREGKRLRKSLVIICNNARGNGGKLTPLGAMQHQQIARRMIAHFPSLFAPGNTVWARSSVVGRCRNSMLAFCDLLRHDQPSLKIDAQTDSADMDWISHESPDEMLIKMDPTPTLNVSPTRLMQMLFKDASKVKEPERLMMELHTIASDLQDLKEPSEPYLKGNDQSTVASNGENLSPKSNTKANRQNLFRYFTEEELQAIYHRNCESMYHQNGPDPASHGIPAQCAALLWRNIVTEADSSLAGHGPSVALRFGHDTALYRLLTLLGITTQANGSPWKALDEVVPMAANLQMPFYRNSQGKVVVRFYLNERPVSLQGVNPVSTENGVNTYGWDDVKRAFNHYIDRQEWLRRTRAINTMVGTDYAVTASVGRYGKGSEEHGQTLPAVLAPHGMNFWTPQTQDTEQKCVAPYYYKDSLFQGFRCSHWIVGGCTQDYGSFTLMPETGRLRLKTAERATPFRHADEISHPYYYAVYLPEEHLMTEMTATSRAAIFQITPDGKGPLHVVVQPNSDERQGFVAVDTLRRCIYGYNPVHRIYQGWGEKAGFSGWFVVQFDRPFVSSGVTDTVAYVTFDGRAGERILVKAASSFTSLEGAWRNLNAEIPHWDFMSIRLALDSLWQQQLRTVEVKDDDTQKVDQFYGALYRASFLPHVVSDVDGAHPKFASGETVNSKKGRDYYADYSMWDVYRAQLPLIGLTQSQRLSDMMQSLVDKYEEGEWMPIFPCWNSYTAAMIGDHAAAALAGAYAQGCRNFDLQKAYEGLRKNAFESPKSYREYADGMGRRALRSYLKYGYIPMEDSVKEAFHTNEQVSRTLEYAYDDYCVAQLAKALGKSSDYKTLMARSRNWQKVINPRTGWVDGRHANGRFLGNKDLTSRVSFITEGAVMHYSFYVPHDVQSLMKAMGGRKAFVQKLDTLFGLNSSHEVYYWHGNEPCHHIPYLYAWAGQPWKTQRLVHDILRNEYLDVPGGLSGNDDAGQMSAWQAFSMMGFYPVCPATPYYIIGTPSFREVRIGNFIIEAQNLSDENFYIQGASYQGKPYNHNYITHDMIRKGGVLRLQMGPKPNKNWGSRSEDCPPSTWINNVGEQQ
ncbi:MAG: GH92 family glycosyl hydrolase [Prevotella sp.]|jgi:predicted alpha-1,2-mannosidase